MGDKITYNNAEDEIDLLAFLKIILEGKKTIIRFIFFFGLIGLLVAVFSSEEYTASVTLVPQTNGGKVSGNLGGLAAMAGINLGGGSVEGISPALYPKITQSIPFQKELLEVSLNFKNREGSVLYKDYYIEEAKKKHISRIKNIIISWFKDTTTSNNTKVDDDAIYSITKEENAFFEQLNKQLFLDINEEDGFVRILFSMPEALPAAQMTKKVQELLQKAITSFKVQKAQEKLLFIKARFLEQEVFLNKAQQKLAFYRDTNRGFKTSVSKTKLEKLEADYNLIYGVYAELAKQLEAQKIQVKEDTPVFTIIKPVSIPVLKSKPKRIIIISVWLFLGFILSITVVLFKSWNLTTNKLKKD